MVKTLSSSFSLPPDPEWVTFSRTDGDPKRWPKNTTRLILEDGTVNYFDPLPIDHGQANKWRTQIGKAIAEKLGYPEYGEFCSGYGFHPVTTYLSLFLMVPS